MTVLGSSRAQVLKPSARNCQLRRRLLGSSRAQVLKQRFARTAPGGGVGLLASPSIETGLLLVEPSDLRLGSSRAQVLKRPLRWRNIR